MEDDDSGGKLNARLTLTPTADASYRIVATSYKPATGRFTLTVDRGNGQGRAAAAGGTPLALQAGVAKVEDRLSDKDDLDIVRKTSYRKVFLVKMQVSREYTINLISKDFDAYLRLEDDAQAARQRRRRRRRPQRPPQVHGTGKRHVSPHRHDLS